VAGGRGTRRVTFQLSPEAVPRIQLYEVEQPG
jgi:hypothetical protein